MNAEMLTSQQVIGVYIIFMKEILILLNEIKASMVFFLVLNIIDTRDSILAFDAKYSITCTPRFPLREVGIDFHKFA